jgi:hypothetical protein
MPNSVVLWWDGHSGLAVCGLASIPVPRVPRVMALDVLQVDYMPGVRRYLIQVRDAAGVVEWRDMTPEECEYVDHALHRMVARGIEEIC